MTTFYDYTFNVNAYPRSLSDVLLDAMDKMRPEEFFFKPSQISRSLHYRPNHLRKM